MVINKKVLLFWVIPLILGCNVNRVNIQNESIDEDKCSLFNEEFTIDKNVWSIYSSKVEEFYTSAYPLDIFHFTSKPGGEYIQFSRLYVDKSGDWLLERNEKNSVVVQKISDREIALFQENRDFTYEKSVIQTCISEMTSKPVNLYFIRQNNKWRLKYLTGKRNYKHLNKTEQSKIFPEIQLLKIIDRFSPHL